MFILNNLYWTLIYQINYMVNKLLFSKICNLFCPRIQALVVCTLCKKEAHPSLLPIYCSSVYVKCVELLDLRCWILRYACLFGLFCPNCCTSCFRGCVGGFHRGLPRHSQGKCVWQLFCMVVTVALRKCSLKSILIFLDLDLNSCAKWA